MKMFDPSRIAKAGKLTLDKFATYFRDLQKFAIGQDKSLGRFRWLQGDALIAAKKKCKHGQWGKFLTQIGINDRTAYLLRSIATKIVEERSMKMTFQEMCEATFPSFRKRLTDGAKAETKTNKRNGKPKDKTISVKQLTADLKSIADRARNLATGKHERDGGADSVTVDALRSAKTTIEGIGKNLARLAKQLDKRIENLKTKDDKLDKRKAA